MGIFYPVRVRKENPNAGNPPFDDEGNDLSKPVPGHPDWARKKNGKKRKIVIAPHNQDVNDHG